MLFCGVWLKQINKERTVPCYRQANGNVKKKKAAAFLHV